MKRNEASLFAVLSTINDNGNFKIYTVYEITFYATSPTAEISTEA